MRSRTKDLGTRHGRLHRGRAGRDRLHAAVTHARGPRRAGDRDPREPRRPLPAREAPPPVPGARPVPDRSPKGRPLGVDTQPLLHPPAPAVTRNPFRPVDPGGRDHEPGPPDLHRAGEPFVRSLLRDLPGRRRHPTQRPTAPSTVRPRSERSLPAPVPRPEPVDGVDRTARKHAIDRHQRRAHGRVPRGRSQITGTTATHSPDDASVPAGDARAPGHARRDGVPHRARRSRTTGRTPKRYVLHDRMFAPVDSWTLPSHLFLVSGWSATCPDLNDPMSCVSDLDSPGRNAADRDAGRNPPTARPGPYVWGDVTWLLYKAGVSWGYFVGPGTCVRRRAPTRDGISKTVAGRRTRLPGFRTVERHRPARQRASRTPSSSRRPPTATFRRCRG